MAKAYYKLVQKECTIKVKPTCIKESKSVQAEMRKKLYVYI